MRLVSVSQPDPETGLSLPAQGEKLEILGDIAEINNDLRVQKALRRLAAEKAATSVSQLVMWKLAARMDWETIAQMSQGWANRHELALARDFVDHLDSLSNQESGHLILQVDAKDVASDPMVTEVVKVLDGKMILGLIAEVGRPSRRQGRSWLVGSAWPRMRRWCRLPAATRSGRAWVPFGKFSIPLVRYQGRLDAPKFADQLAEGVLNRLVRAQLSKPVKENEARLSPSNRQCVPVNP